MGYSRHLTMEEIERIWSKEKDNENGVWISDDLLIKGQFMRSEFDYQGLDFDDIDFEDEYIDEFSEDNYYLISHFNYGSYLSIEEVLDSEDLADRYYYND